MKFLDKLVLKIFSLIILILTIGLILIMTGIIPMGTIEEYLIMLSEYENGIKITIVILAVLMLLAIKYIVSTVNIKKSNIHWIINILSTLASNPIKLMFLSTWNSGYL